MKSDSALVVRLLDKRTNPGLITITAGGQYFFPAGLIVFELKPVTDFFEQYLLEIAQRAFLIALIQQFMYALPVAVKQSLMGIVAVEKFDEQFVQIKTAEESGSCQSGAGPSPLPLR